jgi:hypothetical protein
MFNNKSFEEYKRYDYIAYNLIIEWRKIHVKLYDKYKEKLLSFVNIDNFTFYQLMESATDIAPDFTGLKFASLISKRYHESVYNINDKINTNVEENVINYITVNYNNVDLRTKQRIIGKEVALSSKSTILKF